LPGEQKNEGGEGGGGSIYLRTWKATGEKGWMNSPAGKSDTKFAVLVQIEKKTVHEKFKKGKKKKSEKKNR